MKFKEATTIFSQLSDYLRRKIVSGEYAAGQKLATIREMAAEMSINPNTVVKVYDILEREGLIETESTNGKFVTKNKDVIENARTAVVKDNFDEFFDVAKSLGLSKDEILRLVRDKFDE